MKPFLYWGTCFEPLLKLANVDSPGVVSRGFFDLSSQSVVAIRIVVIRVAQAATELGFLPRPAKN